MGPTRTYTQELLQILHRHYPEAKMILTWSNNFELLVSIILSAQCTDVMVNKVTSRIFPTYQQALSAFTAYYHQYQATSPLPEKELIELVNVAYTPLPELEQDIKSTGFYHNKAKHVQAAARIVLEKFHGILPRTIAELTTIPGAGRKTANVFLGNAYGIYEGIAVDTHVIKQAQAFGLTKNKTPQKIEQDLMKLFDKKDWFPLTYLLIAHGRNMRKKAADRITCGKPICIICHPTA